MLCGLFRGYRVHNIITALVCFAILFAPLGEYVCCMRMVSNLNRCVCFFVFTCFPCDVDLGDVLCRECVAGGAL